MSGFRKLEKKAGALATCSSCGEEIECKQFTWQDKTTLSWCDVDTNIKHYKYDYSQNKTWCKNKEQPTQNKIDYAVKEQNTMMDESNISKGDDIPETKQEQKNKYDVSDEYREFGDKLKQNYRNMFALANEILLELDAKIDLKLEPTDQRRARIIKALQKERELAILGVKKF